MKHYYSKFQKLLLLVGMLLSVNWAIAQQITVTGVVTDANDNTTLPGVNVAVKGTTIGTVTDFDGKYSLQVTKGQTLTYSFMGYASKEVVADAAVLNVSLTLETTSLTEVVVIGYGTVKKGDATGSVTAVSSADFNKGAITSPQELLVGKAAGVAITTTNGAPGAGAKIRIRGGSSLNASNDPLIIIDGVPIGNDEVSGMSNNLSVVNPNDIETFTVLKDASATAIYGSRASNGVIIITTKKGKANSALKFSYNGNTSIATPMSYVDVFSGDEMRKIAYDNKSLFSPAAYALLGKESTDWQKEIFRTSVSHDHSLSVSGSVKSLPFRLSGGYSDQVGILKNTDMQRLTGSLNLSPQFFDKTLRVNINAKAMNTQNNYGESGAIGSAINMDPTQPIYDGNTASANYFQWVNYGASLGTPNPVEQALSADNRSSVNRYIANIETAYDISFIKGLTANLNLATDYTKSEGYNNRPTSSPVVLTNPLAWGKLNNYDAKSTNNLLEFYLAYKTDLSAIKSTLDLTGGYSWQHIQREGSTFTRGVEDATHPAQVSEQSSFITEFYLVSFYGRAIYNLMSKYLVTATLRYDGSSRFADGNRWGTFPSVAIAWKINEESFLKGVSFLSDLKLRVGWGVTGQQDVLNNDYPAQARYLGSAENASYRINGAYLRTLRANAYDPDIRWEQTTTQNIALDFGFMEGRFSGTVDLYKRVTDDLLNTVTIPSGSNFSNQLLTNVGSLENNGVEVALNMKVISTPDMSLNIGANLTYNKNKITKLLLTDDPNYIGVLYGDAMTGQKQVTRVGETGYSYFVNQQVYDAAGNPVEGLYVDRAGNGGTINGDNNNKYVYHNPNPDYMLGFSVRFNYKKFDLSTSLRANLGNYVYNQVAAGASYDQMQQIGYWKNMTKLLDDTKFVKRQFTSDYFVENASFLKMDNITAGYDFGEVAGKLNLYVNFTIQNVFTLTKYTGLDPEVADGIDNNFYPRARTFMLGANLRF
jgi:iron complex outermembrane receptor protein